MKFITVSFIALALLCSYPSFAQLHSTDSNNQLLDSIEYFAKQGSWIFFGKKGSSSFLKDDYETYDYTFFDEIAADLEAGKLEQVFERLAPQWAPEWKNAKRSAREMPNQDQLHLFLKSLPSNYPINAVKALIGHRMTELAAKSPSFITGYLFPKHLRFVFPVGRSERRGKPNSLIAIYTGYTRFIDNSGKTTAHLDFDITNAKGFTNYVLRTLQNSRNPYVTAMVATRDKRSHLSHIIASNEAPREELLVLQAVRQSELWHELKGPLWEGLRQAGLRLPFWSWNKVKWLEDLLRVDVNACEPILVEKNLEFNSLYPYR